MFEDWQLKILEVLKTSEVKAVFAAYSDGIPLKEITAKERQIIAPYYLAKLAFLYDDIDLAKSQKPLGYSNSQATKLILERIERHRKERDDVAIYEGFGTYLSFLHSYDQFIHKDLLVTIKLNVTECS